MVVAMAARAEVGRVEVERAEAVMAAVMAAAAMVAAARVMVAGLVAMAAGAVRKAAMAAVSSLPLGMAEEARATLARGFEVVVGSSRQAAPAREAVAVRRADRVVGRALASALA